MFLKLNHKSLDVYVAVRDLTKKAYRVSLQLPADKKFNMIQQMRRAALSIKLNLSEGASRKSLTERKRFLEIARGSLIEVDAILETAVDLEYFKTDDLKEIGEMLNKCFAMLSNMVRAV